MDAHASVSVLSSSAFLVLGSALGIQASPVTGPAVSRVRAVCVCGFLDFCADATTCHGTWPLSTAAWPLSTAGVCLVHLH